MDPKYSTSTDINLLSQGSTSYTGWVQEGQSTVHGQLFDNKIVTRMVIVRMLIKMMIYKIG